MMYFKLHYYARKCTWKTNKLKKKIDISHDFTKPKKLSKKEEKALNYENVHRLLEGK